MELNPTLSGIFIVCAIVLAALICELLFRVWGRTRVLLSALACTCVIAATFLLAQISTTDLASGVKITIDIFVSAGLLSVATIVAFIANEWSSPWKHGRIKRNDNTVDITKPLSNGGE